MKTIREWLNELPDDYRELALANEPDVVSHFEDVVYSMEHAIDSAFMWNYTPQGVYFWDCIHSHYRHGSPLPPLPNTETQQ